MITQLTPTVRLKTSFSWSTQKVSIQVKKRWFWHTVKSRRFEKDIRAYAEPTMKRVAAEMGLILPEPSVRSKWVETDQAKDGFKKLTDYYGQAFKTIKASPLDEVMNIGKSE